MFFWKIWIPVQIILGGWNFGTLSADMQAIDLYTAIDMVYYLLSGVLFAAALGGFFRWKRSALISVFIQMAANILYVLIAFVLAYSQTPSTANLAFGSVAGTFIRCIPVGIYYYKRRRLFVKGGYSRQQMQAMQNSGYSASFSGSFAQNSRTYSSTQQENSGEQPHFCHNCGRQLPNNPNFCIYCGTKLR